MTNKDDDDDDNKMIDDEDATIDENDDEEEEDVTVTTVEDGDTSSVAACGGGARGAGTTFSKKRRIDDDEEDEDETEMEDDTSLNTTGKGGGSVTSTDSKPSRRASRSTSRGGFVPVRRTSASKKATSNDSSLSASRMKIQSLVSSFFDQSSAYTSAAAAAASASSMTPQKTTTKGNEESSDQASSQLILVGDKKRGVFECDVCRKDLSGVPRIRCAQCDEFDLCLECFLLHNNSTLTDKGNKCVTTSDGKLSQHKPNHNYRVADSTRYQLFPTTKWIDRQVESMKQQKSGDNDDHSKSLNDKQNLEDPWVLAELFTNQMMEEAAAAASASGDGEDGSTTAGGKHHHHSTNKDANTTRWTIEEDLRLLEGISTQGLGNWIEIAEQVGGTKSARKCMERYWDDFCGYFHSTMTEESSSNYQMLPPLTYAYPSKTANDQQLDRKRLLKRVKLAVQGKMNAASFAPKPIACLPTPELLKKLNGKDLSTAAAASSTSFAAAAAAAGGGGSNGSDTTPIRENKASSTGNEEEDDDDDEEEKQQSQNNIYMSGGDVLYDPSLNGHKVNRSHNVKLEQEAAKALENAPSKEEADRLYQYYKEKSFPIQVMDVDDINMTKTSDGTSIGTVPSLVIPPRTEDVQEMSGADISGYMPRREDFDVEWDNDAETQILADMEFASTDTNSEKTLKLKLLQIYNAKLRERMERKTFVKERGLLDYKKQQLEDMLRPPDERDMIHRLRMFARFHTHEEHQFLIQQIIQAKRLKQEIIKLQTYYDMGLTTLAQVERYELDKHRLKAHETASKLSSNPAAIVPPETVTSFGLETDTKQETNENDKKSDSYVYDTNDPASELLSKKERTLCVELQLTPSQYTMIKRALLQEALRTNMLVSGGDNEASKVIYMCDITKRGRVIDFILKAGWITTKSQKERLQQMKNNNNLHQERSSTPVPPAAESSTPMDVDPTSASHTAPKTTIAKDNAAPSDVAEGATNKDGDDPKEGLSSKKEDVNKNTSKTATAAAAAGELSEDQTKATNETSSTKQQKQIML